LPKKLEVQYPERFGTRAMLPLPFVDESLKAIEYAFDTLKVDGVGCMTSFGEKWLGYAEFETVWAELNRRKATIYTHPTAANCCINLVRDVDEDLIEFGADTARPIFSLVFSGTEEKFTDINWIWSHGGGVLTSLAERFLDRASRLPTTAVKFTHERAHAQLRRFYYDTAMIMNEAPIVALVKLVPVSQIVYGTGYPYSSSVDYMKGLPALFKGDDLKAIERENALRLVPRLKST
jgi:hypothetical protein